MRTLLTTLCEIVGAVAVTIGAGMFSGAAAFVVGGSFLLIAGSSLA